MHILPKRQRCILCRIYIPRYATEAAPGYETEPALEMTLMPKLSGQAYAQTSVEKTQQSIQNNLSQSQPVKPQAAVSTASTSAATGSNAAVSTASTSAATSTVCIHSATADATDE